MIKATNLTLRRGTKVLLDNANFVVYPGERLGIVGKNGAGKSTLFALLQKELEADAGNIDIPPAWQIASVSQNVHVSQQVAREFVIDGDTHLRALQHERASTSDTDGHKIAALEVALDEAGIWTAASRAEQFLAGLGFTPSQWEQTVNEFSGGWQMRLSLARALMKPSDLLLLDEPTNHLDLDAMFWLEKWLKSYPGTVLLISHDTEFLNNVAQSILHFENRTIQRYKGNYESFLEQRAERLRQMSIAYSRQQQEIAHMQSFINRFKAKASKAKQAQSRLKALDRMQMLAPLQQESGIHIHLPNPESMPDPLIIMEHLATGYPQADGNKKTILTDINLMVRGGARIGILGVNGAGKSTLVKTLAKELQALEGNLNQSKGVKIAYFAQQQLDMLDLQSSATQHLRRLSPDTREQDLRNYLGSFGFHGDQATSAIAPFSGGEKARLAFALLVWQKPNLLILDEPSNHLDVDTREALMAALVEFEGSMLLVSHDRNLLRTTVDSFWIVADGLVQEFDGDLDDYQQWLTIRQQNQRQQNNRKSKSGTDAIDKASAIATAPVSMIDRKTQKRLAAQERQHLANQRKPLLTKLSQVDKELEKISQRLTDLDALLHNEDFYSDANREQRLSVLAEHGQLNSRKNELEEQWLEINEQLEALT